MSEDNNEIQTWSCSLFVTFFKKNPTDEKQQEIVRVELLCMVNSNSGRYAVHSALALKKNRLHI